MKVVFYPWNGSLRLYKTKHVEMEKTIFYSPLFSPSDCSVSSHVFVQTNKEEVFEVSRFGRTDQRSSLAMSGEGRQAAI